MFIDNNGFFSFHSEISNPKIYSHHIGGNVFFDTDHLVLVWHKDSFKTLHRKDLGKKMYLIKKDSPDNHLIPTSNIDVLQLFSSFDEHSGQNYCFFPKIHGSVLEQISQSLGSLEIVDASKGRFVVKKDDTNKDIFESLYELFVIGGKALIKGDSLSSIKIQITIPLPFFSRKDVLDTLIQDLHKRGCTISGYFLEQKNGGIYEITSNDYDILSSLCSLDKSLASVEKITTKEIVMKVKSELEKLYPASNVLLGDNSIKLFETK